MWLSHSCIRLKFLIMFQLQYNFSFYKLGHKETQLFKYQINED